jgi:hypothetical protein
MYRTLILLSCLLFAACASSHISIDEITIRDSSLFNKFNGQEIQISTIDSVLVHYSYPSRQIVRKSILENRSIENYNFKGDSLIIDEPFFKSSIPISSIRDIVFKGIIQDELGFISEKEIHMFSQSELSTGGGALLGATVGGLVGFLTGTFIGSFSSLEFNLWGGGTKSDNKKINSSSIKGGVVGAVIGVVMGAYIFSNKEPTFEETINRIRESRLKLKTD